MRSIVERCTRIETRLTRYMEAQGFDTQCKRPEWTGGTVEIPSMACAVADILRVVPDDWGDKLINVQHKGQLVMQVYVER